jgi:hypothetical protein
MDKPLKHCFLINRFKNCWGGQQNAHCSSQGYSEENIQEETVYDHRDKPPIITMLKKKVPILQIKWNHTVLCSSSLRKCSVMYSIASTAFI